MCRILLTAFEPYGKWSTNSSWLTLVELTRDLPQSPQITTRLYPVDFASVRDRLAQDLAQDYDFAIHLGQAPGETSIVLESIGLNIRRPSRSAGEMFDGDGEFGQLTSDGPLAYRSELPNASLVARLRSAGYPTRVSHHAGTFVCNATLYLSHYLAERMAVRTRVGFIHLPLESAQVAADGERTPSLPAAFTANALRELVAALAELTETAALEDS